MPTELSLPLIAALLLACNIIARAIGLRAPKNLDEAFGLGGSIALTLLIAIGLHWPIAHLILQPLGLAVLNTLVAILLITSAATTVEVILHKKLPRYFPLHGNLLPQISASVLILALPLIQNHTLSFIDSMARALLFGIGAKLLLAVLHTLHEHNAQAEIPLPLHGPAIELISAGLIVAALSGIAGIF